MAYNSINSFLIAAQVCFAISVILIILTFWGFRSRIDIEKTSIYECGFTPYNLQEIH